MRLAAIFALFLVLVVMGIEIARFMREGNQLSRELQGVENKLEEAQKETASIEANVKYFSRPENLEKEMRARFNYRGADEKLLILVPSKASSASSE
ncbi:MAG: hypothetical protein FJY98_04050 [Candidatus Liptonbacteria bacterium]|nr:hypothetical protein [Candidatus Liptonbacteria bacterium]